MIKTRKKNESGMTVVELIVGSVIMIIVLTMVMNIVSRVQLNYSNQRPRTEAVNDATAALDLITRLIRMAGNNPGNPNPIPNFQAIDPGTASVDGSYRTIRIRSDWHDGTMDGNPDGDTNDALENVLLTVSNNRLMKQEEGEGSASVLLDNVNDMTFTYYTSENVPIANPPASLALIARIDINLVMQARDGVPMTFTTSAHVRNRR
jgi:type IV pilus assembly protein PilW